MSRKTKAAEFVREGYNVTVTGRHVLITDSMKDYALEKLTKIERFTDRVIDVAITMDIQKIDHRVDILIKVGHLTIKSQADTDNMYASIDKAVDKIQAQLRKYKQRLQDHQAHSHEEVEMMVNVLQSPEEEDLSIINDEIEAETYRRNHDQYRTPKVRKQETRPLKTISNSEAIMKLDLSGDKFLVFRDEGTRKICVMYRRTDGDFGVIQTES